MIVLPVGDRLALREASIDDADELFALIERDRDYLGQWLPWVPMTASVDDEREFLRFAARRSAEGAELHLLLTLDGRIIGSVGLPRIDRQQRLAEIGYWLAESEQGHGFITQAVRVVQQFAFDHLGCRRVEIRCAIQNHASRAVAGRLGYRLDEIRPDAIVSGADARIEDVAVYVLDVDDGSSDDRPTSSHVGFDELDQRSESAGNNEARSLLPTWAYVGLAVALGLLIASLAIPASLPVVRITVIIVVVAGELAIVLGYRRRAKGVGLRMFAPSGLHLLWMVAVAIGVLVAIWTTAGHDGEPRCVIAGAALTVWVGAVTLLAMRADRGASTASPTATPERQSRRPPGSQRGDR